MPDLFTTGPSQWPNEVYILCPGESADPDLIPLYMPKNNIHGAGNFRPYVLTVNRSILLYPDADIHMVADSTIPGQKWFRQFKHDKRTTRIYSTAAAEHAPCEYTFRQDPEGWNAPIVGVLRCGTTVLGCALQFCYWMRVKPYIIGADMGTHYYDGLPTHGQFGHIPSRFTGWFQYLKQVGITPEFLTPSPLEEYL